MCTSRWAYALLCRGPEWVHHTHIAPHTKFQMQRRCVRGLIGSHRIHQESPITPPAAGQLCRGVSRKNTPSIAHGGEWPYWATSYAPGRPIRPPASNSAECACRCTCTQKRSRGTLLAVVPTFGTTVGAAARLCWCAEGWQQSVIAPHTKFQMQRTCISQSPGGSTKTVNLTTTHSTNSSPPIGMRCPEPSQGRLL